MKKKTLTVVALLVLTIFSILLFGRGLYLFGLQNAVQGSAAADSQAWIFTILAVILLAGLCAYVIRQFRIHEASAKLRMDYYEQLFNIQADTTNDVFLMLSCSDDKVLYISPNVERVLGATKESILQNFEAIGKANYLDEKEVNYEDLKKRAEKEPLTYETERVHFKTGVHKQFLETACRVSIDGRDTLIVTIADRTAEHKIRRSMQDALDIANAANTAKSTFLNNMSHDIRTPMNSIVGLTILLEKDAEKPDLVRDHNYQLSMASKHLLELINHILDMSKIDSGNIMLNVDKIDLPQMAAGWSDAIKPQIEEKKLDFTLTTELKSERLYADASRITQIMMKLLLNAVKYTPENGHITLKIQELQPLSPNYAHIQFMVSDTGVGMSEEVQKYIFEPFHQKVHDAEEDFGAGFNMAIIKSLVELMGGTIRIRSGVGEGTDFTVSLELRNVKPHEDGEEENLRTLSGELMGRHFLIAEDNELNAQVLTEVLKMMGVTSEVAKDGQEALQKFRSSEPGHFDLILMDVEMPVMDGYNATKAIRACGHPHAQTIPIVALTANAFANDVREAHNAGMDAHLSKPMEVPLMENVLSEILRDNS